MVNHGCTDHPYCEGTTEREHCKFNYFVLCLITLLFLMHTCDAILLFKVEHIIS